MLYLFFFFFFTLIRSKAPFPRIASMVFITIFNGYALFHCVLVIFWF